MPHIPRLRGILAIAAVVAVIMTACASSTATLPHPSGPPVWTPGNAPAPTTGDTQPGDWLRFGFDPGRSGVNPNETDLSPSNVGGLQRMWQVKLPGVADSSPIYLHDLPFPDGTTRNVLYVTTRDGRVVALDAASGTVLWSQQPSGPKITNSSPVADSARHYIYAYGLDGAVHKYTLTTGQEVTVSGWPAPVTRMTGTEKESSALNIAGDQLYVTTSGYIGDAPPYQGHVIAINTTTGAEHIFNSLCSSVTHLLSAHACPAERSGIWSRGGAIVDPITGYVYATTGNGDFDANQGGYDWGDTVLELTANVTQVLDSYTPNGYQVLDQNDADLGSDAPALLPRIAASKTPYLLVQGGKDNILRLLNRQNLTGSGGPAYTGGEVQAFDAPTCSTFTQPAVWTQPQTDTIWFFVAGTCGLGGYQAVTDAAGNTRLHLAWKRDTVTTSPVIANGVLYGAASGDVLALDPTTGHTLWSSSQTSAGGTIGNIHWESLIVAQGTVVVPDESGNLTAYSLP